MMQAGAKVLHAQGLNKVWADGERHIEISIENLVLRSGDFKAIIGASGSGKSTVLDILSLVLRPEGGGALHINDGTGLRDVRQLVQTQDEGALADLRARVFGYVVQTSELIPFLTVFENCTLQQTISGRGDIEDILSMSDALGLTDLLASFPSKLSVGQRQRVAIVRALCCRPLIVLADEPTSAQDPQLKDKVIDLFGLASERGSAVMMVTHDLHLVERHDLDRVQHEGSVAGKNWHSRFYDERLAS